MGNAYFICQADGRWNGSLPVCKAVSCTELTAPTWSQKNSSNFTYSSVVEFKCDRGFELEGNAALECKWNGQWNYALPSCSAVKCGQATQSHADLVSINRTYGGLAVFRCKIGYSSSAFYVQQQCQADQVWTSSDDSCTGMPIVFLCIMLCVLDLVNHQTYT